MLTPLLAAIATALITPLALILAGNLLSRAIDRTGL